MARILIIDDEEEFREELAQLLRQTGYDASTLRGAEEGLHQLAAEPFDLVLVDNRMPRMSGLEFLDALKEQANIRKPPPVIIMTGAGDSETAILAAQKRAFGYVIKRIDLETFLDESDELIQQALKIGRPIVPVPIPAPGKGPSNKGSKIIGVSPKMLELYRDIGLLEDQSVLILGETGTGKELIAQAIYTNSTRKDHRMVPINCGAREESSMLEDELFGHEKGAFTGATTLRKGYFEHAHGGTIFLDEIGDMPLKVQNKLLRVLQEGKIMRLGSSDEIDVDVRVLAATSRDLAKRVQDGTFRSDLYYRLEFGAILKVPSLRDRKEDIEPLAEHFLRKEYGDETPPPLHPDALRALKNYAWPGNIRSLQNVMGRARQSVRKRHGAEILPGDLDFGIMDNPTCLPPLEKSDEQGARDALRGVIAWALRNDGGKKPYPLLVELLERELLAYVASQARASETRQGSAIGVVKNTLRKWKEKYPDEARGQRRLTNA